MDIVERLRTTRATMLGTADEHHFADCHEAADEIERLRGALEKYRGQINQYGEHSAADDLMGHTPDREALKTASIAADGSEIGKDAQMAFGGTGGGPNSGNSVIASGGGGGMGKTIVQWNDKADGKP